MTFQKIFPDSITTILTAKPDKAQIEIANPIDRDIFIDYIELTPDFRFSKYGKISIELNEVEVFSSDSSELEKYALFVVPLQNNFFKRQNKIKVYAWNGVNSNSISVGVSISMNEEKTTVTKNSIPKDATASKDTISELEEVFAQQTYANETRTKLIDMQGFKKMILMIGNANITLPTIIVDDFGFSAATKGNAVDGDLSTKTNSIIVAGVKNFTVDFGSQATRIPACKFESVIEQPTNVTYKLQVSNDNVNWTDVDEEIVTVSTSGLLEGASQSFRYMRLQVTHNSGVNQGVSIFEMYNSNNLGGTASFSFETKDTSGNWIILIPSSLIGTTTTGGAISKQLGDVINDVSTNKFNVILPSTQTDFRAKMIVSGGNLNTGMSIIKV